MTFRKFALFFFSLLCLLGVSISCSCNRYRGVFRVAIDPNWYPLNFKEQTQNVNGFIEELLLLLAQSEKITFEKIETNWDSLLDGLSDKRYDAVITSLPRYDFHLARYDFSENVLDLGPILVVRQESKVKKLKDLSSASLGTVAGADVVSVLQSVPRALQKSYFSLPELLDALENEDVEAALIDALDAYAYVQGPYFGKLKIVGAPLNQKGLHFLVLKGTHERELKQLNEELASFKKKAEFSKLLQKWQLE